MQTLHQVAGTLAACLQCKWLQRPLRAQCLAQAQQSCMLLWFMSRLPHWPASPAAGSLALAAGAVSKISAGIQALDLDAVSTPVSSQGHAGSKHPANVSPVESSVLGSGNQVGDCSLTQPYIGTR